VDALSVLLNELLLECFLEDILELLPEGTIIFLFLLITLLISTSEIVSSSKELK
jgi:hypothetical protein